MKKPLSILLFVTILFSVISSPAYATSSANLHSPAKLQASDVMTFSEMVQQFASSNGCSYAEALNMFPTQSRKASATYRTLWVELNVTTQYSPRLEFYCETSEWDSYWGILSIYSVQMNRRSNSITKQFAGDVQVWLRSPYQIEYVVNGDFYDNGTTTTSGGIGVEAGLDKLITITFDASVTGSTNHYAYCYQHETASFQQ